MDRTPNQRRAMRVEQFLTLCQDWDTAREGMIDLLTDARHWCDRHGESFAQLERIAYQHYIAEFSDEQKHKRRKTTRVSNHRKENDYGQS